MTHTLLDFNIKVMAPEMAILAAVVFITIIDLVIKENKSRWFLGIMSLLAVGTAGAFVGVSFGQPAYQILNDTYRVDDFSLLMKLLILGGSFIVTLLSISHRKEDIEEREGEFYSLFLTAVLGAMIMVSSADLITLFVGLELLSLSSYILVGIYRSKWSSNESAWKYVVLGGVSTAFILYGMSFLYGVTGSTNLFEIQQKVQEMLDKGGELLILLSFFLMLVGFAFKIATAPFHMWTPDVYQGAPTPITSFLAIVSKTAAFAFILRILIIAYIPLMSVNKWQDMITPALVIIAGASMIIGNAVALKQTNSKRLMAYSSISQAGYLFVPFASFTIASFGLMLPSLTFYLCAYLFMTFGAFAIIHVLAKETKSEEISAFSGLYQRSPWLAIAMSIFLISLAGLPITAGFFGKFYLIMNALATKHFYLTAIMIGTTVISYYYYFGIIRQMYFRPALTEKKIVVPITLSIVIIISLVGTIGLGVSPDWVLQKLGNLNWISGFTPAENANMSVIK